MRILWVALLLVCCPSGGFAQNEGEENFCNRSSATTVDHNAGVIVQKVILSGEWGSNEATVYLPNQEIADAAVVFSHSEIYSDSGTSVDLLTLALTLAHAGAAVIVPQRSLVWPERDASGNRKGAVVICAAHWLVDNVAVFNHGIPVVNDKGIADRCEYGYVGPRLCDPAFSADCRLMHPLESEPAAPGYHRATHWVPVGEAEGGDNTRSILADGGLRIARYLQRYFGLTPISSLVAHTSSSHGQ